MNNNIKNLFDSMAKLSVCMIVKNEESVLDLCLHGVSLFADEIVIVDTGSRDDTKKIASKYTDKIYDYLWQDDFAAARNFSFSHATGEYIMWIDADDIVNQENAQKILELKMHLTQKLIMAGYDRPENGGIYNYLRMVHRESGFVWKGRVHERLMPQNKWAEIEESDVLQAEFIIRHNKPTAPAYERNICIMAEIPKEELRQSFWFCAQCFIDCVLAGKEAEANKYLALAGESGTPFLQRLQDYAVINKVLKFHGKYDAMLKWNRMYMDCKKGSGWNDTENNQCLYHC